MCFMDSALQTEKEAANEKLPKRGLLSAGKGSSILGPGFLIQYVLYSNGMSFDTIMYKLTTLGIGQIFYDAVQFFS
jgi:hypothetical protein